jgi:hypothetical protein
MNSIVWIYTKISDKKICIRVGISTRDQNGLQSSPSLPCTSPPPPLVPILFIYRPIRTPSEKVDCTVSLVWHIVNPLLCAICWNIRNSVFETELRLTFSPIFYLRLINLKHTLLHLAGTKNSSWKDRICFWQDMKIFAEIEFRQKRIIPFSCSSYFVSESYLTHNTYIFFWLSYWLVNIDSSPKNFVRFEVPPNVKVCVLDLSVLFRNDAMALIGSQGTILSTMASI